MQEHKTQVIIAGAGPTGLMLANQLERFGIKYILIDRKTKVIPESRAMTVHARTLEFMEQLGLGEEFLSQGKSVTYGELYTSNQRVGQLNFGPHYRGAATPYPFVLDIEQNKTEKILLNNLRATDSLWFETTLEKSGQDAKQAWVEVTNEQGKHRIQGQYLVGCDGAHSVVRVQSGLEFSGKRYDTLFLVMDVYGTFNKKLEGILVCLQNGTLALGFSLLEPGKFRTFVTLPDDRRYPEDPETAIALTKPELPAGFEIEKVVWHSYYKASCKMLEEFRDRRIFFAGDAAHVHSPAGGQGMNTGIGDAVNLGWKLAYTLNHPEIYPAKQDLLATYSPERTRFAKGLLNTTDKIFSVIIARSWFSRLLIAILPGVFGLVGKIPAFQTLFFSKISQLSVNHRESSLSQGKAGALTGGDRFPYFSYRNKEGKTITSFELLTQNDYRVFVFGDEAVESPYRVTVLEDEAIRRRFRLPKNTQILVRPDMYIQNIITL